ncbi:SprT family zinc-dependent metalloprotease [Clostridium sp. KNHs214]|uniref:M48 family metallopeptidase n=1 Tax=Clostridium sp. KNHs214 TaxID=1540257 RepID=UPI00055950DF|nr:SprT family zinc-dependent metalloprotease [Clostridium sp. KNHs214]
MNSFVYKGKEINYTLKRSRRRTIGITITEEGQIIIFVPVNLKKVYIDEALEKRAKWIEKKLELMRERQIKKACRKFENGEKFYLLGKEYTLKIFSCFKNHEENRGFLDKDFSAINCFDKELVKHVHNNEQVYIDTGNLCVSIAHNLYDNEARTQYVKEAIKKFYIKKAMNFFKERVEVFSKNMGIYPKKVTVKEVKTLWGSCSSKGNITLNWKLIMAPPYVIDYVVVHELCHLRHMDHSKDFWMEVEKVIPDYKYRRKWLKENGHLCKLI